jgi:DNA-directed RNA polymerase specialized sigma24 family protein
MAPAGEPSDQPSRGTVSGASADARSVGMLRVLRLAVASACLGELASQREDLVQVALLRVLEHERAGEQNTVRTASYLWRVAFTVTADELRRRRSEAGSSEPREASTPGPELCLGIRIRADEAMRVLHWDLKRVQHLTAGWRRLRRER